MWGKQRFARHTNKLLVIYVFYIGHHCVYLELCTSNQFLRAQTEDKRDRESNLNGV